MSKIFNKTLIIGLGLIGGSFAKALKKNQVSAKIFAFDLDEEAIALARDQNVIDEGADDFLLFADEVFDLVVVAAPLSEYEEIFEEIAENISSNAVIIDLGSIKEIKKQLEILPQNLRKNFVPCHPIGGSEKTGFKNSAADLFLGKKFIICGENSDKNSVEKIEKLAKEIGAIPDKTLTAVKHDEIYALMSHLPQFLSFLTKDFSPKNIHDEFFKNAFRLDNSDSEIWQQIFAMNERNLEKFYLEFFENLEKNIKQPLNDGLRPLLGDLIFGEKKFDEKFFEENFVAIFFRVLVVLSYLQIPEVKTHQNYAGSGFRDFTSIIKILNYDEKKLTSLIQKNQQKIRKFFNSIN